MRTAFIRRCIACLLILSLATTLPADSISDKYRGYVDKAIPLSVVIVESEAAIREAAVFAMVGSEAQSHLSAASGSLQLILDLAPLLKNAAELQRSDITAGEVIAQVIVSTQIVDQNIQLRRHLAAYRRIASGLSNACDKQFDDYKLQQTSADFTEPGINPWDGIFIMCGVQTDQSNQGGSQCTQQAGQNGSSSQQCGPNTAGPCDLWTFLASVGITLWNLLTNWYEQMRIQRESARLASDRAQDKDYREFAKIYCRKYVSVYKPIFQ
jgi:hypothetical protein